MPLTVRTAMRKALRTRLAALSGLPLVLYQGQLSETPVGTLHVRERLRLAPESTDAVSLGPVVFQRMRARYELTVRAPFPSLGAGRGTPATTVAEPLRVAESWADTLAQHFRPGTTMVSEGFTIVVDRASTGDATIEGAAFAECPVAVSLYTEFTAAA